MKKLVLPRGGSIALLAIAAMLLVLAGAGCAKTASKTGSAEKTEGQVKEAAQPEVEEEPEVLRTDVAGKQAMVDAAAKINDLRKAETPDYAEIENIFSSDLKEMVGKRDGEAGTTLVADIENAIAAAKAGTDVALNGQRVSKSLIRAFYLAVKHEFEEAESLFADKSEEGAFHKWDEAQAYWGGVRSIGYVKDHPDLIDRVEAAFEDGRNAIAEEELLEMKLAAQVVDKISIRGFVGAVAGEADEAQGADAEKALVLITEAQVYYTAVADKFKDYDQQISAALGSPATANPDTIRGLFGQGLADKVIHEAEEVIVNWETEKAAVVALEAVLYMEALQDIMTGKEVGDFGAVQSQLAQLEAAVSSADKAAAERLVVEVTAAVNGMKSKF